MRIHADDFAFSRSARALASSFSRLSFFSTSCLPFACSFSRSCLVLVSSIFSSARALASSFSRSSRVLESSSRSVLSTSFPSLYFLDVSASSCARVSRVQCTGQCFVTRTYPSDSNVPSARRQSQQLPMLLRLLQNFVFRLHLV